VGRELSSNHRPDEPNRVRSGLLVHLPVLLGINFGRFTFVASPGYTVVLDAAGRLTHALRAGAGVGWRSPTAGSPFDRAECRSPTAGSPVDRAECRSPTVGSPVDAVVVRTDGESE